MKIEDRIFPSKMRISDLIEKLEEFKEEYGDIPVRFSWQDLNTGIAYIHEPQVYPVGGEYINIS